MTARVVAVSVGAIETRIGERGPYRTAIGKRSVAGAVALGTLGFAGDEQADRRVHGGPDMAAYAYASEDYAWWSERLARELPAGLFGENLLLAGFDVSRARLGDRWRVGATEVVVTLPRIPCATLGRAMADPTFVKTFAAALRPGAYLAVAVPGEIRAGDAVTLISRPDHDVTIAEAARLWQFAPHELASIVTDAALGEPFLEWARGKLARLGRNA